MNLLYDSLGINKKAFQFLWKTLRTVIYFLKYPLLML